MSHLQWMDEALCREVGQELFFPEGGQRPFDAIRICKRCDVQDECLSFALRHSPVYGVWGGTTEAQRRRIRRVA